MRQGRLLIAAILAAALLAACGDDGGGGGEGVAARPASPASDFPAATGRTLQQVLQQNATAEGPVVAPAARVLRPGENRFSVGVFTLGKEQITDADLAIYAAPRGIEGAAIGPFPARIEDITTEPAFRARSTSEDPDAAKVVYVADIPLNKPGEWAFGALTKLGEDGFGGSLIATPSLVGQFDPVGVGDRAPRVHTQTAGEVADISEIDTRVPAGTMHDEDLADVLGKKPVVLLFATPALCQSRICGPVVDVAEQVKRDHEGDEIAFIHQEVYVDNDLSKGEVPQMRAFDLNSEPWLYVIDREGKVSTVIEGAYSVDELEAAVQKVLG